MQLTNFKPYEPTVQPFGQNVMYLKSEEGKDWYQAQREFDVNTLKIMYDNTGKIIAQSRDISTLYPINASVIELDTDKKDVIGLYIKNGKLVDAPPSDYHQWNDELNCWVMPDEVQIKYLTAQRDKLLIKLANKVDELKTSLLVGYPQTEIESFYRQEKEALAWKADKTVSTPMLTQIATMRGVPFEILVEKVLEKSAQFAVAIGVIIGQRQAFEDKFLAIKTPEELTALEQEVEQWQLPSLS